MTKMTMTIMKNIQFKESQYDYDHILIKRGYEITTDYEDRIVFTKAIKLETEGTPVKYNEKLIVVSVTRPKIIDIDARIDIASPYIISFNYLVAPHHCIRRMVWDTFPGVNATILDIMLGIAEEEAKLCGNIFIQTDSLVYSKIHETPKS